MGHVMGQISRLARESKRPDATCQMDPHHECQDSPSAEITQAQDSSLETSRRTISGDSAAPEAEILGARAQQLEPRACSKSYRRKGALSRRAGSMIAAATRASTPCTAIPRMRKGNRISHTNG